MISRGDVGSITVVGSIVLDHKWYPVGRLSGISAGGYPLWKVERRPGGVGRNVAENLAVLGVPVSFVGLSGTDETAMELESRLAAAGVDLAIVRVPDGIGRFDVHLDDAGQLSRSTIRLPDVELLSWDVLINALPELGNADIVVAETGLAESMLAALRVYTRRRGIRLLGMPTRIAHHGPRWSLIRQLDLLVLNETEAAAITGLPRDGELSTACAQASAILAGGPPVVVLTCGSRGAVMASADEPEPRHIPAQPVPCVDDTGAGDALVSGLLMALAERSDLASAVACGLAAARLVISCPSSSCRRLSTIRTARW